MFKYPRLVLSLGIRIIYEYFAWMLPYSRHPERYPLELRYKKARGLVIRVLNRMRVDFHVENKQYLQKGQIYFMTVNHYSVFDPLMLIAVCEEPVAFVGKESVKHLPFVGRIFRAINGQFMDRSDLRQELLVVRNVQKSLRNKECSWAIYPEGTRNKDYQAPMRMFKAGSFKVPLETGTPILPIASYGTQRPLSGHLDWKRYPVFIRFLEPINPDQFIGKNTYDLAQTTYDITQTNVDILRALDAEMITEMYAKKPKSAKNKKNVQ